MKEKETARKQAVLILGAAVYALLFALCSQIDQTGSVIVEKAIVRFFMALPVAFVVLWVLFRRILPWLEKGKSAPLNARLAVGIFVFLLCCYSVMFLINYPGSFMYDTQRQVFQIARNDYEMFHPLVHTLLIRACLSFVNVFDSFEKCAALYSVITLTIAALCFSQVCVSIGRMYGKVPAIISAAFFGLYPSHMAFASNCTKDGLFSAFFALFFALCFEEVSLGGLTKRRAALKLVAGTLACLLRNNMIYAIAVWTIVLLVSGRRHLRNVICCLLSIALCIGMNSALQYMTKARDGSKIEMLSVPIQQLSRARLERDDCFTQEEKDLMDLVFVDAYYHSSMPLYERYEPTLADPVKNYLDEALVMSRISDLTRMWLNVGAKCPDVYLDAFLNLTLPSLYPYSQYRVAQPYIETGLQPGVVTAPFGQKPMTQPGRFQGIRDWLNKHIFSTGADDIPVIRWLFNTGAVYWFLLMIVFFELYSGNHARFVLFLLPTLLWGTYLLGPVMQGRYLYPFVCVLPLFMCRRKMTDGVTD